MSQADVLVLLPLVTQYTPPTTDPSLNVLYPVALTQITRDAPNCAGDTKTLALTYYIAYLIGGGKGKGGVASEKIDDYAIAYKSDPASHYHAQYMALVDACNAGDVLTVASIAGGVTRDDDLRILDLDASRTTGDDTGGEFV